MQPPSGSTACDGAALRTLAPPIKGAPLLGSALVMGRDMLGFLRATDRDHGPVSVFRVGPARWVLASRAEAIEDVLVNNAQDFDKPDAIQRHGNLLFGNALSGLKGAAWRSRRTVVAPAFHRSPLDADAIGGIVAEWADRMEGARFALHDGLSRAMTQVLCASLLRGADSELAVEPTSAVFAAIGTRVRIGVPLPDWLPAPPVLKMRRGVAEMRRCFDSAVARGDGGQEERPDLRGILTSLRDDAGERLLDDDLVRKEVSVMVGVGGRQLGLVLAWALYLLDSHPAALGALQEEVDRVLGGRRAELADLDALPFVAQVIDETLRLYPSIYVIFREALRDTSVAGWRIPRGAIVMLSPWVTQRLPEYYERPDEFIPERWTAELRRALPRAAYSPFGGGSRTCLAQASARKQLALALVAIVACHRVRPDAPDTVEPQAGILLELPPDVTAHVERRA
jgi:cytochrome P450